MADSPEPLLVYDRIDGNRRNTRLLIAAFAVAVMPFAWFAARRIPFNASDPAVQGALQNHIPVWLLAGWTLALAVAFTVIVAYLGSLYCQLLVGRESPSDAEREPEVHRLIENLCIAAGLPVPKLYVMECAAPNAFAIGYDPAHASLVVTRGLLDLLDRREQQAVMAHELSHIGNHDTSLSMKLAALLAVTRAPLNLVKGLVRSVPILYESATGMMGSGVGILGLVTACALTFGGSLVAVPFALWIIYAHAPTPTVMTVLLLLHMFVIAPALALRLRKTISHQREFLADADAVLLTRDPEGLALALAKVSAASGTPVHAAAATAHLFFVDPLPTSAAGNGMFASHPPVDARVAALARMGDGIIEGLSKAGEAGLDYRGRLLLNEVTPSITLAADTATIWHAPHYYEPGAVLCLTDAATPLYRSSDRRSDVIRDLAAGAIVTVGDAVRGFYKARTHDGTEGYLDCAAGLRPSHADSAPHTPAFTSACVPRSPFRLTDRITPLYAKPDGWSAMFQKLPAGEIVTFLGIEGQFARVQIGAVEGYIPSTARAELMGALQPPAGV